MGKMKDYIDNDEGSPTSADLYLAELERIQTKLSQLANEVATRIDYIKPPKEG